MSHKRQKRLLCAALSAFVRRGLARVPGHEFGVLFGIGRSGGSGFPHFEGVLAPGPPRELGSALRIDIIRIELFFDALHD